MMERWAYQFTLPTGMAPTYDIIRAVNQVDGIVEGNADEDPYSDEGWKDVEFIASVWCENNLESRARLIAAVPELRDAFDRACKLIDWMAEYIGDMAPGSYSNCFADLNEHFLFVERRRPQLDKATDGQAVG